MSSAHAQSKRWPGVEGAWGKKRGLQRGSEKTWRRLGEAGRHIQEEHRRAWGAQRWPRVKEMVEMRSEQRSLGLAKKRPLIGFSKEEAGR